MATATTWVPSTPPNSDFSLANLPLGIITTRSDPTPRPATAIGMHALDLKLLSSRLDLPSLLPSIPSLSSTLSQPTLNAFAQLGRPAHRAFREFLQDLLSTETTRPELLRDDAALREEVLVHRTKVMMELPMEVGDYTDFYAGEHHARAVGVMFRGAENALQPNYKHLPVGYHGRASSVVVSGTGVHRPVGQILVDGVVVTAASRKMDFELELGCFVGRGSEMGKGVGVDEAEEWVFGYVLLNDWSARDVQAWEYVPLGPFNGKNFATTVSGWVVLADALEPYRAEGIENGTELQGYLKEGRRENMFDISLEVELTTAEGDSTIISRTSSKNLLWSFPQMIAHHTLGGCPMRAGDLLGSGTISGPRGAGDQGSLLEMTDNGKKEVLLAGMDARRFLKDGDTITLRGHCGPDGARVGFGDCRGRIYSAAGVSR
ncbi:hypothetical protein C8A05DRAFT_34316 [Staphylotrichum tortipilum]|uniref:Fumarylacetoacetase n=1 Tax=Staphylotrichum tortipilum TaxID=2831512 RepID=A0AAN6MJE6_9PEZI|nr:hypothetical protein C8A05DRAFT_34316 [Staphylotrichum longicolle]